MDVGFDIKAPTAFNIQIVQDMVAQYTKDITMNMVKALMQGLQENLNFKGLAVRFTQKNLKEELSSIDEKTQLVYQKLFRTTQEHIAQFSPPCAQTLQQIQIVYPNSEASDLYLGSFVLPAAKSLVEQLKLKQPGALENLEIWKLPEGK